MNFYYTRIYSDDYQGYLYDSPISVINQILVDRGFPLLNFRSDILSIPPEWAMETKELPFQKATEYVMCPKTMRGQEFWSLYTLHRDYWNYRESCVERVPLSIDDWRKLHISKEVKDQIARDMYTISHKINPPMLAPGAITYIKENKEIESTRGPVIPKWFRYFVAIISGIIIGHFLELLK